MFISLYDDTVINLKTVTNVEMCTDNSVYVKYIGGGKTLWNHSSKEAALERFNYIKEKLLKLGDK